MGQPLRKTVWRVLKKGPGGFPSDREIPLQGLQQKTKNMHLDENLSANIHGSPITTAKRGNSPNVHGQRNGETWVMTLQRNILGPQKGVKF